MAKKHESAPNIVVTGDVIKPRKGLPRSGKPVILPEAMTILKQPNLITAMSYDYKAMQLRAFIAVIEHLQGAIEESIAKKDPEQLMLFQESRGKDKITLTIPIKQFGIDPRMYSKLKECLKELASIPVELDAKDPITGVECWVVKGLLEAYIPKESYQRTVTIFIDKDVAKMLVGVDKGFTKFIKEIALASESKYTMRLYMLISSWKDKGGFVMPIAKFRKWLDLGKKYPAYKDLYRWVIRPVYEELFEKADCWFEINEVYKSGEKEPYKLNFKIVKAQLSAKEEEMLNTQKKHLESLMFNHLRLSDKQISQVLALVTLANCHAAVDKAMKLIDHIQENITEIQNPSQYATISLVKALTPVLGVAGEELPDEEESY